MKLKISGNGSYQIEEGIFNSRLGDSFVAKEEDGCLVISSAYGSGNNINISGEGDLIIDTLNGNINISNSFNNCSGSSIKINGVDMTNMLNNLSCVEQEDSVLNYEIKETITEIIISGNAELKVMNQNLFSENLNIICSGNSYIKFMVMKLNNVIGQISGNTNFSISDSKVGSLMASSSGCSTLKFVNSSVENLNFSGSGCSTLIKDKSSIKNLTKNLKGVASFKEVN